MDPIIIGLSGKAGSGKSEVAKYLEETHGFTRIRFSDILKDMLRAYYSACGLTPEEIERRIEGDLKEEPDPLLDGKTLRYAMQTLGTEWGRTFFGMDFWVTAWERRVRSVSGPVVVEDVRFDNEATKVLDMGGFVFEVDALNTRRGEGTHVSDQGISTYLIHGIILNHGTIQDLYQDAEYVVRDITGYVEFLYPNSSASGVDTPAI